MNSKYSDEPVRLAVRNMLENLARASGIQIWETPDCQERLRRAADEQRYICYAKKGDETLIH